MSPTFASKFYFKMPKHTYQGFEPNLSMFKNTQKWKMHSFFKIQVKFEEQQAKSCRCSLSILVPTRLPCSYILFPQERRCCSNIMSTSPFTVLGIAMGMWSHLHNVLSKSGLCSPLPNFPAFSKGNFSLLWE